MVQFFNEEFELRRKLNAAELRRFLKTLAQRFEVVFGRAFTKRVLENVLCKVYRILNNKKANKKITQEKWCDTLQPGQLLFDFTFQSIVRLGLDGGLESIEGDAVMTRFPYGDELLTMAEVVSELRLPTTLPSNTRTRQFHFYAPMWSPRAVVEVDFTVPDLPTLSKEARDFTQQVLRHVILSDPVPKHSAKRSRCNI